MKDLHALASNIAARFSPEFEEGDDEGCGARKVENRKEGGKEVGAEASPRLIRAQPKRDGDSETIHAQLNDVPELDESSASMTVEEYMDVYDRLTQAAAKAASKAIKTGHGVGYTFPAHMATSITAGKLTKAAAAAAMQGPEAMAATTAHIMGTTPRATHPVSRRSSVVAAAAVAAAIEEAEQEAAVGASASDSAQKLEDTMTPNRLTQAALRTAAIAVKNGHGFRWVPRTLMAPNKWTKSVAPSAQSLALQGPKPADIVRTVPQTVHRSPSTLATAGAPAGTTTEVEHDIAPGVEWSLSATAMEPKCTVDETLNQPDNTSTKDQPTTTDSGEETKQQHFDLEPDTIVAQNSSKPALAQSPSTPAVAFRSQSRPHIKMHTPGETDTGLPSPELSPEKPACQRREFATQTCTPEPKHTPQSRRNIAADAEVRAQMTAAQPDGNVQGAIPVIPARKKRVHKTRYMVKGVSKRWDERGGGRMKCALHFGRRFEHCPTCSTLCAKHREDIADCPKCNEGLKSLCKMHLAVRVACAGCGLPLEQPQKKK